MGILAILFIVVPAVEMALLIEIGGQIGGLNTLMLIIFTGIVGAALAKRAGLDVLRRVQAETQAGRLPTGALVDGAIILFAGALLLTPGVLTDLVGFACLVPGVRSLIKRGAIAYFERAVKNGQIQMQGFGGAGPGFGPQGPARGPGFDPRGPGIGPQGPARGPTRPGPVIDVTARPSQSSDRQAP